MKSQYRVVVIGGGVVGASIAYHLTARPDFRGSVVVIERDPTYARASTALSAQVGHSDGLGPNQATDGALTSWNAAHTNQNCANTAPRGGAGRIQVDRAVRIPAVARAVSTDGRVSVAFGSRELSAPTTVTRSA